MPNVLSPRDLVSRPDNMDEAVPHISYVGHVHIKRVYLNTYFSCSFVYFVSILLR